MAYPETDAIEREQIEWVHGLTGGELADRPLRFAYSDSRNYSTGKMEPHEVRRGWARYWYEGAPEWSDENAHCGGRKGWRGNWITLVWDSGAYGDYTPPTSIRAQGRRWRKVASYPSSAECECPGKDSEEPIAPNGTCPLCDGDAEERHGYIYLGEGWLEAVYYSPDEREDS